MKPTLTRSPFIPETAIYTTSPQFVWDGYDPYSVLSDLDAATKEILEKMTDRGRIAYSLGCSEWVVFTLLPLIEDNRPLHLLEAFWAFQMSDRYALPDEFREEEWLGQVRGPIDLSLVTVRNTVIGTEEGDSHLDASFAELIPLHILPDPEPFYAWREHALKALTQFTSATTTQRGDPVPRELIMDSVDAQHLSSGELVNRFLDSADPAQNPFLIPVNK
jgi:hypothetical protein